MNELHGILFEWKRLDMPYRFCQVGITSSPPALMTLCIAAAEACHEEKTGLSFSAGEH
jgi:hypothetical protein